MRLYAIKRLLFAGPPLAGRSSAVNLLIFLLAFVMLFFCFFVQAAGAGEPEWKFVFNPPLESDCLLNEVAYGGGSFVAVGERGAIMYTSDGANWISCLSGIKSDLFAVAYGNGMFVAVGDMAILYSKDGINWEKADFSVPSKMYDVVYGKGKFVAVSNGGDVVTSADGKKWTAGANWKNALLCVGFANGIFTATGSGINLISEDGTDWKTFSSNSNAGALSIVASMYKDNRHWGIGKQVSEYKQTKLSKTYWTVSSPNGYNWIAETLKRGIPADVLIDNMDKYILEGILVITPEGKVGPLTVQLDLDSTDAAMGNGRLVAVLKSSNIKTYIKGPGWVRAKVGYGLRSLEYGNGKFVAVGNNTVVTSEDGEKWTPQALSAGQNYEMTDLAFGNGRFVAAGRTGILESTDGVQWREASLPVTKPSIIGVASGKGGFVAAGETAPGSGQGLILTSLDGVSWSKSGSKKGPAITGIASGGGMFAVCDSKGAISISHNGANWSEVELSPGTGGVKGIAYGNGRFVAVTEKMILISFDGAKWTSATPELFRSIAPDKIKFADNSFVIPYYSRAYKSRDGVEWESADKIDGGFVDVASGNGKLVALHSKDSIMSRQAGETSGEGVRQEGVSARTQSQPGGEIVVTVNGEYIVMDQPPARFGGRIMVPLRNIFEALGAQVVWNGEAQTVMATRKDKIITFRIGDSNVIVSDRRLTMDPVSQVVNGRTLVPVRFVSEALGAKVDWDEAANAVRITAN